MFLKELAFQLVYLLKADGAKISSFYNNYIFIMFILNATYRNSFSNKSLIRF